MNVTVKTLTGTTLTINVDPSATIEEVKQAIAQQGGPTVEQQRLMFTGKKLEDGRTLSDYNILEDAQIDLVQALGR